MLSYLLCLVSDHDPVRHPLGGFRCANCGKAGRDLDEMGFHGDGYVSPKRAGYARPGDTLTVRYSIGDVA